MSQQTTAIYARLDLDPVRASAEEATAAMLEAAGIRKVKLRGKKKPSEDVGDWECRSDLGSPSTGIY